MKKIQTLIMAFSALVASLAIIYGISMADENHSAAKKPTASQYVKPHADIELRYTSPEPKLPGEITEILLSFSSHSAADTLQINIQHDDELSLLSDWYIEFSLIDKQAKLVRLQVITDVPGKYYIDLSAVILIGDKQQARTFTIPIVVLGDVKPKTTDSIDAMESKYRAIPADGVISMPATETIR